VGPKNLKEAVQGHQDARNKRRSRGCARALLLTDGRALLPNAARTRPRLASVPSLPGDRSCCPPCPVVRRAPAVAHARTYTTHARARRAEPCVRRRSRCLSGMKYGATGAAQRRTTTAASRSTSRTPPQIPVFEGQPPNAHTHTHTLHARTRRGAQGAARAALTARATRAARAALRLGALVARGGRLRRPPLAPHTPTRRSARSTRRSLRTLRTHANLGCASSPCAQIWARRSRDGARARSTARRMTKDGTTRRDQGDIWL